MALAGDDSFKRPGAVPFKWEIRPGVPKIQQQKLRKQQPERPKQPPPQLQRPSSPFINHQLALPAPPHKVKLKPPPPGYYISPPDPRTRSFRSAPRIRSDRWRVDDQPARVRQECVSPGCFPSPMIKRKETRDRIRKTGLVSEPDCFSDLDTISRWSLSTRRSFSSFRDSPKSSLSSSRQSSPRIVGDPEWAGFGLF